MPGTVTAVASCCQTDCVDVPDGSTSMRPYSVFMDVYAAFARQLIRRHGITQRQIAAVSAKNHRHSIHNERAQYRTGMTIDEVLAERIVRTLAEARNPLIYAGGGTILAGADEELRRFAYKVEAGAEFCITQPVFDLRLLEEFLRRIEGFRIPVIAGIWPLTSLRNAEFMKTDLRVSMPEEILAL